MSKYIEIDNENGYESTIDLSLKYLSGYQKNDEKIPTIAGLAVALRVSRNTIGIWAKQEGKEDFGEIYELLMATQELKLINSGLDNTFNAQVTKMLLSKHGHSDRTDSTNVNAETTLEELDDFSLDLQIKSLQDSIKEDEG